jgi:signal transduction histidine kinase
VQDRLRFETFLANLSATVVNIPATEVDSQIEAALRQIVEFLDLDRSGFGELSPEGLVITHSYEVPGVPPSPRGILEAQFPFYARKVHEGEVFRLPEDLPAEATREREFCARTGLKSSLTIPLKLTGSVVGGIGFASFRSTREWPDELVQRLRLVGDIFTNALARKRADEALRLASRQAAILRNDLAHATRLELISHLTTSIAHEVNQPLYAIASNAQTAIDLLGMGDAEEAKKALEDIWADARRASEVIGRVRGMLKKDEPSRSLIPLAAILDELAPLLHREAVSKGAALRINLEARDTRPATRSWTGSRPCPAGAAPGALDEVPRRHGRKADGKGRRPADPGSVEDHRRGNLRPRRRLARPQRPQEDRQAVLLLLQPGPRARHGHALPEVLGHARRQGRQGLGH